MKKSFLYRIVFLVCLPVSINAQERTIEFFKDNTFVLDHFLIDNVRQEVELHQVFPVVQDVAISFSKEGLYGVTDLTEYQLVLNVDLNCGNSYICDIEDSYFKVINFAGGLLSCGGDVHVDNLDFEGVVTGFYDFGNTPTQKVYYTIDEDEMGFRLYSERDVNTVLVFKKEDNAGVRITEWNAMVKVYVDSNAEHLLIETEALQIEAITCFDTQGRELFTTTDISVPIPIFNLPSGFMYCSAV